LAGIPNLVVVTLEEPPYVMLDCPECGGNRYNIILNLKGHPHEILMAFLLFYRLVYMLMLTRIIFFISTVKFSYLNLKHFNSGGVDPNGAN
jgi:hypothetical protein